MSAKCSKPISRPARVFVPGVRTLGESVALFPEDAHKLTRVLRLHDGARIEVIDGAGVRYEARITMEMQGVSARLETVVSSGAARDELIVTLAQALPKGQKMDFVVEKATELGVAAVLPLQTRRVVGEHVAPSKRERWERIAREAARQSGRTTIPTILPVADWETLCTRIRDETTLIPWELAPALPLRDTVPHLITATRALTLVIGPEGGLAEDEIAAAVTAGAHVISLGERILRTETAALVTLAALRYARGEI